MKKLEITYNDTVKEALALALIEQMKIKPFTKISISEIVLRAGVGRSSFYRNFTNKEQILLDYIQKKYNQSFQEERANFNIMDMDYFLLKRLNFIKNNKDFFVVLRKNNLLYYLFEEMDPELAHFLSGNKIFDSPYSRAIFSSCSAGIIKQWIDNNFKESPEDLLKINKSISFSKM